MITLGLILYAWAVTAWAIIATCASIEAQHRADAAHLHWLTDELAVARAAGVLLPLDHTLCEGGCRRVLCCCRPLHTTPRCPGTVEQVCGHLNPLCEECAVRECDPCLADLSPFGGAA